MCVKFDGEGGWKLEPLDTGKMMTLQEERHKLETQLAGNIGNLIAYVEPLSKYKVISDISLQSLIFIHKLIHFSHTQGISNLEERLGEVRRLLGEDSTEAEPKRLYDEESSNNEESPVEIIT